MEPESQQLRRGWLREWLAPGASSWVFLLWVGFILLVGFIVYLSLNSRDAQEGGGVVVYCAQDEVYAEPLLRVFTQETGVKVRAVYDNEAVKTIGLANRLLAEREHPQCDVFWGNEELRTRQLAARGVFRETNGWAAMGYRSRRMAVNTNLLAVNRAPRSLLELTNATWRRHVALAYPLFGTTATHFLALRQYWGTERWTAWCQGLATNQPFLVDGNSVAAQFVARGEAWLGLSDSDDIAAEQREGAPVTALPLNEESLLIPNTVAVVRGCPHPEPAQRLFAFLQRPEVLAKLVTAKALEGVAPGELTARTLKPDWDALLANLDAATAELKRAFLR